MGVQDTVDRDVSCMWLFAFVCTCFTLGQGCLRALFGKIFSGPEKGVITKGVFSFEESLQSLNSLNSLESLENGRILLCFPHFGVL